MKKVVSFVGFLTKTDPALAVSLQFVVFGIAWILFSDSAMFLLGSENILWQFTHIHILKGLLFVGISGAFIFYWVNRYVTMLAQKETELSTLFQTSPLAMAVVDASTFRFLDVNDAMARLYDFTATELLAMRMEDLAAEKEKYETLPLIIKTGRRETGVWKQVKKSKDTFSVQICAQPVRDRKAWLIMFVDVTHEVEIQSELSRIKNAFEDRLHKEMDHLTRINEELAYRASQTEHVNTELIAVNERLQMVNKRIASQSEETNWKNISMTSVMEAMQDAMWSFDLTAKTRNYISPSTETLFEEATSNLNNPWFWLDFVHPDDESLKEVSREQLLEKGETTTTLRIVSKKGMVRLLHFRIKLVRDAKKGSLTLMGAATDISNVSQERQTPMLITKGGTR